MQVVVYKGRIGMSRGMNWTMRGSMGPDFLRRLAKSGSEIVTWGDFCLGDNRETNNEQIEQEKVEKSCVGDKARRGYRGVLYMSSMASQRDPFLLFFPCVLMPYPMSRDCAYCVERRAS
jgi:hypothetical protein